MAVHHMDLTPVKQQCQPEGEGRGVILRQHAAINISLWSLIPAYSLLLIKSTLSVVPSDCSLQKRDGRKLKSLWCACALINGKTAVSACSVMGWGGALCILGIGFNGLGWKTVAGFMRGTLWPSKGSILNSRPDPSQRGILRGLHVDSESDKHSKDK